MFPEAWAVIGPLAAAVVVSVWKGSVWFFGWVIERAVDQFTDKQRELWQQDIQAAVDTAVEPILYELSYNDGKSLKDAVRRIERSVEELHHS